MDMINVPVTLIVKAPNQQIEDQTIKCEPSWSIRKLKGYLAEVYPSNPRTEDQKLIYSGQLLSDTVILKDVLRKYDGQDTHTVHLVCSSSRESIAQHSPPVIPRPSPRMNENRRDSTTALPHSVEAQTSSTNIESSNDGLRQRLSTSNIVTSTTPQCNIAASGTVIGPGSFPSTDPRAMWAAAMAQPYPTAVYDPNNLAQQLMYMQQAYVQYMSQYMQMLAANASQQTTGPQPTLLPIPEQPPVNNNHPEPPADDMANAPAGDEEDGRGNRDWLDWFYIMSRVMVLFSIVYFYSSPTRFVLVSALGVMMYLYQVGFFRAHHVQPVPVEAENNNHAADARLADNNNLQNQQEEELPVNNQAGLPAETEPANEAVEVQEERPSLLALTWTFFSTFFASLIPEQPGV